MNRWIALFPLSVSLALACSPLEPSQDPGEGSAAAKPEGSEFESLGEASDSRIYYQFIDQNSQVVFVERLEDVPDGWRDKVGYVEMDVPPPLSPQHARKTRREKYGSTSADQKRRGSPHVVLYYADWCPHCHRAKRHLDRLEVAYEMRDVDVPAAKAELIEKTGQKGIPVIEIDGKIMKGYSEKHLDRMLRDSRRVS